MKYKCANCHEEFESNWSDDEAREEFREMFGREMDPELDDVVCDPCHNMMINDYKDPGRDTQ